MCGDSGLQQQRAAEPERQEVGRDAIALGADEGDDYVSAEARRRYRRQVELSGHSATHHAEERSARLRQHPAHDGCRRVDT